ncbi:MAG TPA: 2-oxoglutarate dehydrogenase E1 component [Anaerolineales bacterium]|nr:2-oxoglutarate dehydrogenase E1 component [Anaerolineales bacterium]
MNLEHEFHGANLAYVLELQEQYHRDPNSLDESTRKFFETWKSDQVAAAPVPVSNLQTVIATANLAQAIREQGYLAADLNPLFKLTGDSSLTLEYHNLREEDLRNLSAEIVNLGSADKGGSAYEAIEVLRSIYCGTIGFDYAHVHSREERDWLHEMAELGRFRDSTKDMNEVKLLERLTQVEAFEMFLHRLYPGKTRFSIEGLDMMIPMLDEVIASAGLEKICAILIGMAHRGRLNVLAHILNKPYSQILAEFNDPKGRATTWDELGWTGDVKYHMGGYRQLDENTEINLVVRMPANPSHLEQIDPVVMGMARAANTAVDRAGAPRYFQNASFPILIHGDASFVGQGIVAETLNLSRLPGYTVSGTLHIIANNQLGFTATDPELRSSLHASDLAVGFEMPVIHVNADDPYACIEAVRTAFAYRQKFHKDFVINLIGYRRYGHNEGDEPRFTQPVMYQKIDIHPSVRKLWASRLEKDNVIPAGHADEILQGFMKQLQQENDKLDAESSLLEPVPQPPPRGAAQKVKTGIPLKRIRELNQALLQFPKGFALNPKLVKSVERRLDSINKSADKVDWATAEEIAFASILQDGIAIRLTGQDTARGTFSQRHAEFYDAKTNQGYIPLQSIPQAQASFEVLNSPLSEVGAIGYEIGYNVQSPERLVIWEAQYGDFVNNAQGVIDEFLVSARAKWGFTPSLVMLLPHGNEGQGPDHSSGRIERFLALAAETNMRVAYPSTAAQYFHLLRRQAMLLKTDPLPLIVFTPKGLLRHPSVASPAGEFAEGSWQAVMDDTEIDKPKSIDSLILCSGRIYVDLVSSNLRKETHNVAIARLEQLYPFPKEALEDLLDKYPHLQRLIWVQEEPLNMGAWNYLRPRLRQLTDDRLPIHYVGRPESSSPAEGSSTAYRANQQALIEQAFKFDEQAHTRSVVKERG